MTGRAVLRPSFGLALGETARKVGQLHRRALAERGADFPSWMLLTLLSQRTSPVPVEDLVEDLERRMDLPRTDSLSLLQRAVDAGLVVQVPDAPMPTVALTAAGSAYFADLYAHARAVTDAASTDLAPAEVEATIDALLAVDARAASLLEN